MLMMSINILVIGYTCSIKTLLNSANILKDNMQQNFPFLYELVSQSMFKDFIKIKYI